MASIVVMVIDVIAVNLQMHRRQNHHDAHIRKVTTRAIKRQAKVDLKSQSTIKIKTRQKWRPSRTMIRQSSAPSSRLCQSSSSRTTCRYNIFAIMIITVKIIMQYWTHRNHCSNNYNNRQNHHDAHIRKVTTRAIKRQAKVDLKSQSTIKIKTRQKWRPSRTMIRQSSAPSTRLCRSSSSWTTCRYNIFAIMIITVNIMMQYGTYRNQCSNDYNNCHSYYYYRDWDH